MSRANSYVIDTNIVNYILDGELWAREPASLMRARPELVVAYSQAGENFEATDNFYPSLRLSKLAHRWCVSQSASAALRLPHRAHRDDASTSSECISIKLEYWYTSIDLIQDTGGSRIYVIFIFGVEEFLLGFGG